MTKQQTNMSNQYGIKLTIPDKPPLEQAEMIESFIKVIRTLEQVTGDSPTDLSEMETKAAELRESVGVYANTKPKKKASHDDH